MYRNIYKGGYIGYCMTNQIERMKRIRIVQESIPKKKISKKKFMAICSLDYGISVRTIENYLNTLIDAERVGVDKDWIWRI